MIFQRTIEQIARNVFWREIHTVKVHQEIDWYPEVKFVLDEGAYDPYRKHSTDAGYDLACMYDFVVPRHNSVKINTGVHVQLPPHTKGVLMSRSGLICNECVTTTGLIDQGYTGPIKVRVYNHGEFDKAFKAGDRITQLVISPVLFPTFVRADELDESERGSNGLGSTGR